MIRRPNALKRLCGAAMLASAAAVLGAPAAASAGTGAGVSADPIVLPKPAHAGGHYHLPGLYVVNTGDETSAYHVRLQRLASATGIEVPAAWVHIREGDFQLGPGKTFVVPIDLDVPKTAAAGHYGSDLIAATVLPGAESSLSFGAAAATGLEFTVSDARSGGKWLWVVAISGLVSGAIALTVARGRQPSR